MNIIDPLHPAQSAILEVLSENSGITTDQLLKALKKRKVDISKPNLYKLVARMIQEQVLVKAKGKLLINSVWITNVSRLLERAQVAVQDADLAMIGIDLKEGERREFYADSLRALDPIWNHLMVLLCEQTSFDSIQLFNSHAYYQMGMLATEGRLYRSLSERGKKVYFLFGNDTFLDHYSAGQHTFKNMNVLLRENTPFPKDGYMVNVFGEYMIECIMPKKIADWFAHFFDTVDTIEKFDEQLFQQVFTMKEKCKLVLRRNKKDAEAIKDKIIRCFREK